LDEHALSVSVSSAVVPINTAAAREIELTSAEVAELITILNELHAPVLRATCHHVRVEAVKARLRGEPFPGDA